ncbi:hypothetical protein OO013_11310 [Mangrovivirga sp. M17]|uniref:Uncharacterized protein n=1 Tax=Mangrovivirga halotolerans TaxID=2993936 RepID=A0ABT3RRP9_9BACT|nr:hypothetical protein [Mangrovivirga halotolerans]MCX2744458.1 hypothetical protein [Mangrovivirga halotolerans]
MSNLWKEIGLTIMLLSAISTQLEAQEITNWQILEDNDSVSIYYSSLVCGDEIILVPESSESLSIKVVRKTPEIKVVSLILKTTDGTNTHQGYYTFIFDNSEESVYDCTRLPHQSPTGPLPFSSSSSFTLVDLFIETL